ncbi:probable lipoprotein protein YPO1422 [Vibrio ponticus]|nr:probable lipoprotein protein YPO1422 [Vibrio ponticus]
MRNVLLIGILALAGCSNQAATSYQEYLLPEPAQQQIASPKAPLLMVEVELAPYLDVNGIVYRTSATEVVQAKQHAWAMDLNEIVEQQTLALLRRQQQAFWPVELNPSLNLNQAHKLVLKLEKFNGSYSGNAEVAGQWLLLDESGDIIKGEQFAQSVALKQSGYQSLVLALNSALSQAVASIAPQL